MAWPAANPYTTPPLVILTREEVDVLQLPPVLPEAVSVVFAPAQTEAAPEIEPAFGSGLTVIVEVATLVPQPFVTL